jgi:hypothetical protein
MAGSSAKCLSAKGLSIKRRVATVEVEKKSKSLEIFFSKYSKTFRRLNSGTYTKVAARHSAQIYSA